jgi:hypothetical protein
MFNEIGHDAIGEINEDAVVEVVYAPVSRILSGGTMQAPKVLPEVGLDLINDEEDLITNDDGEIIGTEAR